MTKRDSDRRLIAEPAEWIVLPGTPALMPRIICYRKGWSIRKITSSTNAAGRELRRVANKWKREQKVKP